MFARRACGYASSSCDEIKEKDYENSHDEDDSSIA